MTKRMTLSVPDEFWSRYLEHLSPDVNLSELFRRAVVNELRTEHPAGTTRPFRQLT